jgi:hypothetical protein
MIHSFSIFCISSYQSLSILGCTWTNSFWYGYLNSGMSLSVYYTFGRYGGRAYVCLNKFFCQNFQDMACEQLYNLILKNYYYPSETRNRVIDPLLWS